MPVARVHVVDSHTEGEPTRVVVAGGPDLARACAEAGLAPTLANQRRVFAERFDAFRAAVVNEPRGAAHLVGALLVPAVDARCAAGVVFFNNVGVLNGCGHGTMGVARTLLHLSASGAAGGGGADAVRARWGAPVEMTGAGASMAIETPVGVVDVRVDAAGEIAVRNVPSVRTLAGVELKVPGLGLVRGDVAWGGNWFFLCEDHGLEVSLANLERLTEAAWRIRQTLERENVRGEADEALYPGAGGSSNGGGVIDHVELFGPPSSPLLHSRNFVLCPGKEYDRSPCGTGTSAKVACLVADGKLRPGEAWRQESVIGSRFTARAEVDARGRVIPTVAGRAFVTGESTLLLDPEDPFVHGITV